MTSVFALGAGCCLGQTGTGLPPNSTVCAERQGGLHCVGKALRQPRGWQWLSAWSPDPRQQCLLFEKRVRDENAWDPPPSCWSSSPGGRVPVGRVIRCRQTHCHPAVSQHPPRCRTRVKAGPGSQRRDPQTLCYGGTCPRVAGLGASVGGESTRLGRGPGCPHADRASGTAGPSALRRTVAVVNVLMGNAPVVRLHSHAACSEHPPPPGRGAWPALGPTLPGASENVNSGREPCQLPSAPGSGRAVRARGREGKGRTAVPSKRSWRREREERTRQARKGGAGGAPRARSRCSVLAAGCRQTP